LYRVVFFFSSRRRHTRSKRDWSSDVCSSDLEAAAHVGVQQIGEEPQRAGAVGEGVEHLEAHAAAVMHHPEQQGAPIRLVDRGAGDRKSTRLNSSHVSISYAVFCLKKKRTKDR